MTKDKILEKFDELCLPNGEKFDFQKENKLLDLLASEKPILVQGLGIIVPAKSECKKVVVSHFDLVYPFLKGFSNGQKFFIEENETILRGGLDNTITNAVLVLAILELRGQGLAEDVEFVFTDGEESGLWGMNNYMKNIFPQHNNPFFINLDVTNDNWDFAGSIEFDYPCYEICVEIENKLPLQNGFTHKRFTDDTSCILHNGGNGFSYCIPTDKYCHTYESYTLVNKLEPYYNGLITLIKDIDTSKYVHNMETLSTFMVQNVEIDDSTEN